jgi:hypothetical protein
VAPSDQNTGDIARWKREHRDLERRLETARDFTGFTTEDAPVPPGVALRRGERAFLVLPDVDLVEEARGSRTPTAWTVADTGTMTITDRRVVLSGGTRPRQWDFVKVSATHHHDRPAGTTMRVANRKLLSGVAYDPARASDVRFLLDLAWAHHAGTVDSFRGGLERELAAHESRRPHVQAGAWVWRGWSSPVPVGAALLAFLVTISLLLSGGGGDRGTSAAAPLRADGLRPEVTLEHAPPTTVPPPPTTAPPAPLAPDTGNAAATPVTTPAPPPPSPPSCAPVTLLGVVAVGNPACP